MEKSALIDRLRALEPELRRNGVERLYLFGSASRGEAGAGSDVDLFCDLDPHSKLGFAFFSLADRLAEALGKPVDLTTRDGLHPLIRADVTREAIQVF